MTVRGLCRRLTGRNPWVSSHRLVWGWRWRIGECQIYKRDSNRPCKKLLKVHGKHRYYIRFCHDVKGRTNGLQWPPPDSGEISKRFRTTAMRACIGTGGANKPCAFPLHPTSKLLQRLQKSSNQSGIQEEMEESSEDLEDLDVTCSLYISPMTDQEPFIKSTEDEHCGNADQSLTTKTLQSLLKSYQLMGKWNILKTTCGFLISFTNELDADKVVSNNLAAVFGPMQIVRLHGRRSFLRQAVFLREVPWAIQLNDLKEALVRQGITSARVERKRHHVRVEVCEPEHYETLLRRGLNFFGAIRFQAIPDRGIRSHHSWHDPSSTLSSDPNFVLQCYRCQGFWHIAANCRHEVRCVRCGDHHSVQFCPRPRSDPVCCHCSGPHHAAYRFCPVRLDLVNAVPVSLTLTTRRAPNRYLPYPRN